jgi:hypothetical protein
LSGFATRGRQQCDGNLLEGAAQSFAAATAIKEGVDSGHPLNEDVGER